MPEQFGDVLSSVAISVASSLGPVCAYRISSMTLIITTALIVSHLSSAPVLRDARSAYAVSWKPPSGRGYVQMTLTRYACSLTAVNYSSYTI